MATMFSFHEGPPLNLWEKCSLQSFADFGHELTLFSYSQLDVPSGVRLAPAADIIPEQKLFDFITLAPDQFSQFSDWFRYELLYKHGNWWVDTDVVCSTPSLPDDDIVVGKAVRDWLNNGVIKFPARHPLLAEAVNYCNAHWREVGPSHRSLLGPILLTELDDKYNIRAWAKELTHFSPLSGRRVWRFSDPVARDEVASAAAKCPVIHWWQWRFRAAELPRDVLPPKGSFLADLFLRHGGQGHPHIDLETYCKIAASNRDKPQSMPTLANRRPKWLRTLARLMRPLSAPKSVTPLLTC